MALIVLQVLIVFTISSFLFHQFKLLCVYRQRQVVPSSADFNPLEYRVWALCCSLITSCNQTKKTISEFKDALQMILICLTGGSR